MRKRRHISCAVDESAFASVITNQSDRIRRGKLGRWGFAEGLGASGSHRAPSCPVGGVLPAPPIPIGEKVSDMTGVAALTCDRQRHPTGGRYDRQLRKHIMNITHTNPESTPRLGSLKKLATHTILASGLSLALIGLGTGMAGTANATTPSLICPATATTGSSFNVTFANFTPGQYVGTVVVTDAGATLGSGTAPSGTLPVKLSSAGYHSLTATQLQGLAGGQLTANCVVQVVAPGGTTQTPPVGGGGGLQPKPKTCPFPASPGLCHQPGPIQRPQ
jgi:hypothetical protein